VSPDPGQTRYHPKSGRYIAAWFPPSFSGGARESFEANKDILDEISPFWYSSDSSGRLYGNPDEELVRIAQENNVLVIPALHNISNFSVVIGVLSDPYVRARHVQNIVDEVLAIMMVSTSIMKACPNRCARPSRPSSSSFPRPCTPTTNC
jgi:hypothetical protein